MRSGFKFDQRFSGRVIDSRRSGAMWQVQRKAAVEVFVEMGEGRRRKRTEWCLRRNTFCVQDRTSCRLVWPVMGWLQPGREYQTPAGAHIYHAKGGSWAQANTDHKRHFIYLRRGFDRASEERGVHIRPADASLFAEDGWSPFALIPSYPSR